MTAYVRFAAIVLGAFLLGLLLVSGWTALVSKAVDINDRMRRARCDWVDPIVVSIADTPMTITATPTITLNTGTAWIGGEEHSGYRRAPVTYGFCLDAPQTGPLPVRSVHIAGETAEEMAARAGLPEVPGPVLEVGEAALFLPDAPEVSGNGSPEMSVYFRNVDYGWPRMVSQSVDRAGFRIGAICRDGEGEAWACEVAVLDTTTGLSYRYGPLSLEAAGFDAAPPPDLFVSVAYGMRALGVMLREDTVARR